MNARRLFAMDPATPDEDTPEGAPLGGTRSEAVQRLQIGVFGICAMILLVGLASIIGSQADMVEETAVPDAAPTTEPTAPPARRVPLADAGVVPPSEPSPGPQPQARPGAEADPLVTVPQAPAPAGEEGE